MRNILGEEIPDTLYKYMPWPVDGKNYTKEIFIKKKIHLSKPKDFNDPFEFKVNFLPSAEVNEYGVTPSQYEGFCQEASEEINGVHQENDWVTCMTKCPDNILMWSHYAAKHTGVCLELKMLTKEIMKVDYDKLYPTYDIGVSLQNDWSKKELSDYAKIRGARKSLLWSYEEEYRYVTMDTDNIVDGKKFILLKDFAEITGVICGCRMKDKTVLQVEDFLRKQGFDIPVKRAKEKKTAYGLDII
jgi:Protein of unknown function (DUF2971).